MFGDGRNAAHSKSGRSADVFLRSVLSRGEPEKRWKYNKEMYRSGRNEADSKSVVPMGTGGSNPSISAVGLQWFAAAGFFFCLRRLFCVCPNEQKKSIALAGHMQKK